MATYYKGKYKLKNPGKYEGDPTMIIYRSSWELKFLNWCDSNDNVISFSSEETIIPYVCPTDNRAHRYFVDFKVKIKNKNNEVKTYLVEIKPYKQTLPPVPPQRKTKQFITEVMTWGKNEAKWKAAKKYAEHRGWEFIILTEKELGV